MVCPRPATSVHGEPRVGAVAGAQARLCPAFKHPFSVEPSKVYVKVAQDVAAQDCVRLNAAKAKLAAMLINTSLTVTFPRAMAAR